MQCFLFIYIYMLTFLCTSRTLINRSRPWFSIKWRQVVGDSSVRFQSALSVNLRVASTMPWVAFWLTMWRSCCGGEGEYLLKKFAFFWWRTTEHRRESHLHYEQLRSQLSCLLCGQLEEANEFRKTQRNVLRDAWIIQRDIYLRSQYGNDSHSHPLHVLVFMVAEPLHH